MPPVTAHERYRPAPRFELDAGNWQVRNARTGHVPSLSEGPKMWGTTMLAHLVTAICRRPVVTMPAALLLSGLAGWYSAGALRINSSTRDMISPGVAFRQHDKVSEAAFPDSEDRIV